MQSIDMLRCLHNTLLVYTFQFLTITDLTMSVPVFLSNIQYCFHKNYIKIAVSKILLHWISYCTLDKGIELLCFSLRVRRKKPFARYLIWNFAKQQVKICAISIFTRKMFSEVEGVFIWENIRTFANDCSSISWGTLIFLSESQGRTVYKECFISNTAQLRDTDGNFRWSPLLFWLQTKRIKQKERFNGR